MDFDSILSSILSLFKNQDNIFKVLALFNKNENESLKENPAPNPNDQMWQLPQFDFDPKKQNFVNQNDFNATKNQNFDEKTPKQELAFDPKLILEIAKIFQELFKKPKEEAFEEEKTFISSLKRCDS